jgi:hypothetical protein
VHRHPAIHGGEDPAPAASRLRAGNLAAGARPRPLRRVAPRLVPHMLRQCAGRRAGLRHGAILALTGVAHRWAQRRTDTTGAMRGPACQAHRQRTSGLGQRARSLGVDRTATWLDNLQMWQQSLAGMALQEGQMVIRQQEPRDRRGWDCPGDRLATADSAPGIRCPVSSPSRG